MRGRIGKKYSAEVHAQACQWFVEFRACATDERTRQDFHGWLQQAPAHMAAYLEVASRWNGMGALDVSARFPKEALLAEGKGEDNLLMYPGVVSLRAEAPRGAAGSRRLSRSGLIAAAGVFALTAAAVLALWLRTAATYSTGIGQKRLITLADGSVVHLNARSRIVVRYTRDRREVDLVRGQALFVDTYEPNRPFIVRSRATVVRAVGTQFDVNLLDAETIVTVIEGKVAVAQQRHTLPVAANRPRPKSMRLAADHPTVYVSAGEQLTVTPARRLHPVRANVSDAIAWMHQKLIFSSTALSDVVQEFNRYNTRQVVIASPSLDTFRIDGVFSSTDPASLIAFLRQYPGIAVRETDHRVLISRQKPL